MLNRTGCVRAKRESRLAAFAHVARCNTVMATKRGSEIGGVLIATHPRRLLHAVAFKQIATRQREPTFTQVIEKGTAVALTKLAAQAARAHGGEGGQLRKSMILLRRLVQPAAHAFKTRMLRPAREGLLALRQTLAQKLLHQPFQQQLTG